MSDCYYRPQDHRPMENIIHPHEHEHDHDHHHDHHHDYRKVDRSVLKIGLSITFIAMIIEAAAGIIAGSLALVSDAIHMLTHSFALGLSLLAIIVAYRKSSPQMSYGYYRIETLAAFVNGFTIALSVIWILYEAVMRLISPHEINLVTTLIVAVFGLIVNLATGFILMKGDRENINIQSAFLHMLTDAISSVAIVIGAVVMMYTQWYIIDTALAVIVAVIIGKWSFGLLRDSVKVLMEGSPVDVEELRQHLISSSDMIEDIHDVHVWEIAHNMYALTAHITIDKENMAELPVLIDRLHEVSKEEFCISHSVFQPEWAS